MKQTKINKKNKNSLSGILLYIMVFALMAFSVSAATATFVDLGESKHFAVLSKAAISNVPTSAITGDVGISPAAGTFITGLTCPEVTGAVAVDEIHMPSGSAGDASCEIVDPVYMTTVVSNMETAYAAAQAQPNGVGPFLNLGAGTLIAQTLNPGVYTWSSNVLITDDLTLDCLGDSSAVFVFQILSNGKLELSAGKQIILAGNCQAGNVFWAVEGLTNLLAGSHLEGTVLGSPGTSEITLTTGSTVLGRLLGEKTITLDANTVTLPALNTDSIAPSIILNAPANNSFTNNNQSAFDYTFSDVASANGTCSLFVNNTAYNTTLSVNNTAIAVTPNSTFAEGTYEWYVACRDLSGNVANSTSRVITVDKTVPSTPTFTLSASSVAMGSTLTGSCSAVDNLDPNVGTSITGIDTSTTGAKTATCTATDAAGNSVSTTADYAVTSVSSGSSGGGGGGGSSTSSQWTCSAWSTCNSDGVQTKTCTTKNGGTSTQKQGCAAPKPSTTAPTTVPQPTTPVVPKVTNTGNTGTTDTTSQNTPVAPTNPSPITGQVTGSGANSSGLPSWAIIALVFAGLIGLGIAGYVYSGKGVNKK